MKGADSARRAHVVIAAFECSRVTDQLRVRNDCQPAPLEVVPDEIQGPGSTFPIPVCPLQSAWKGLLGALHFRGGSLVGRAGAPVAVPAVVLAEPQRAERQDRFDASLAPELAAPFHALVELLDAG